MLIAPVSLLRAAGWISVTQLLLNLPEQEKMELLAMGTAQCGPMGLAAVADKEKLIQRDRAVFHNFQG